jgi:hypothetical protein
LFSAELAFRLRVVAAHAGAKFSFFRQNGELSRQCRWEAGAPDAGRHPIMWRVGLALAALLGFAVPAAEAAHAV